MTPELLLNCVSTYNSFIGTKYRIHIGRAGKLAIFQITINKEDCHHLMGLQHLSDRPDTRSRTKIFDELMSSEKYRNYISESELWNTESENRVICTMLLNRIIEDNKTIIRYSAHRLNFYSTINAEYILQNVNFPLSPTLNSDLYLFIDKRAKDPSTMFCKSIFIKNNLDYTVNQEKWTLLYKEKTDPLGVKAILYQHKKYNPTISSMK